MTPEQKHIAAENLKTAAALFRSGAKMARDKGIGPVLVFRVMRMTLRKLVDPLVELDGELYGALRTMGDLASRSPDFDFAGAMEEQAAIMLDDAERPDRGEDVPEAQP